MELDNRTACSDALALGIWQHVEAELSELSVTFHLPRVFVMRYSYWKRHVLNPLFDQRAYVDITEDAVVLEVSGEIIHLNTAVRQLFRALICGDSERQLTMIDYVRAVRTRAAVEKLLNEQ